MKAWVIRRKGTDKFVNRDESKYTDDLNTARLWTARKAAREARSFSGTETVKKVNVEVTLA